MGAASVSSRLRITDRSIKFCNSRIFPGHLKDVIAFITLGGMIRMISSSYATDSPRSSARAEGYRLVARGAGGCERDCNTCLMVLRFFEGENLTRCAHDGVVHLPRRFSQEKGTIQNGITFKYADHKGQAIKIGQSQNRDRFPHGFERIVTGLQVKFES